ncbi:MAG TPA: ECF RNA polymerase sigma factor SigK [Acidimicrobiia bacterium]|nr:ECF RNA polymerase sigma factor SigK [Acidimicrobiia bacterium]
MVGSLLTQVAHGSRDSFAQLYDAVATPVFGLIKQILRDPAMSEEVAQEVMLEVWKNAPRYDPSRGSALTWILVMAHRRAVDRVRSEQAARERVARVAPQWQEPPHDPVEESALRFDQAGIVRRALAGLTDAQRQAIELAYYQGLTQSEIAGHLGVPLGTVKTRIRDGLQRLQTLLRTDP